jgi:hypothetical protein
MATVLVEIGGPVLVFYVLRAFRIEDQIALIAGAAVPCLIVCLRLVRNWKLDVFGSYILLTMLARESWLTGASGLCFLLSLAAKRPLAFLGARVVLEGRTAGRETWDSIWARDLQFRRIWRVSTIIWGVALLIDAGVRIVLAANLPIDAVPGLMAGVSVATMVILQPVNGIYYFHAGLWNILRTKQSPDGYTSSSFNSENPDSKKEKHHEVLRTFPPARRQFRPYGRVSERRPVGKRQRSPFSAGG